MSYVTPDQFHDGGQLQSDAQDVEDELAESKAQSTGDAVNGATWRQDHKIPFIHRSASEVNIVAGADQEWNQQAPETAGLKKVLSEKMLLHSDTSHSDGTPVKSAEDTPRTSSRRSSIRLKKQPKFTVSQYTVSEPSADNSPAGLSQTGAENDERGIGPKSKSSRSLSAMAKRRSWIPGSRSPSPSNRKVKQELERQKDEDEKGSFNELTEKLEHAAITPDKPRLLKRQSTFGITKSKRPLSAIMGKSKSFVVEDTDLPPIPKSLSTDRLPTSDTVTELPALPTTTKADRLKANGAETRKKDELWNVFRNLDSEHTKFASKPGTLKANMVRSSLLPFLRSHADHPSNKTLRAEDLDRRINILNKWWTGLLEMINGRNGQSVTGSDRPAVLEGLTGLMTRPEWRLPLSAISSKVDRNTGMIKSRSASSLESTASDFLAESVLHNVRTTFIQNLLSQMAFIVDRMSLRSVPASVVTFCGKASAYAFIFCPGVADILVRLWSVSQDTMKRVLSEAKIPHNYRSQDTADWAITFFPPHLKHLAFTSLSSFTRSLRGKSPSSTGLSYIPWYGPWVGRWAGRDSDLLFCFIKTFHVLVCGMLPDDATTKERLCAPCVLLVEAQLLAVMDTTIHRVGNTASAELWDGPLPITFDDVLGADASANPLPVRAPNAARLMAENRLIMLLREFLSESPGVDKIARETFAEDFGGLLKAAVRRTSLYDHNACFTLCDFLEESLAILARYHGNTEDPAAFLDWEFWFKVLKQMGDSNNSMTEVRLYAFVYSLWGLLTKNDVRKRDICLNWLLEEKYAYRQFNHWCPMVRAYYMRLLCWRVVRNDGEPSKTESLIFRTVLFQLQKTWCHFLHIQREAESRQTKPLSTAPSNPAPGRRLLIIRDDSATSPGVAFLSFDGIIPGSASQPSAYEKYASLDTLKPPPVSPNAAPARSSSPSRKRLGLLRSMIPFVSSSTRNYQNNQDSKEQSLPPGESPPISPSGISTPDKERSRQDLPSSEHTHASFKFSLEWNERSMMPPRDRPLAPPRLPHTAQAHLLHQGHEALMSRPIKPEDYAVTPSKYCGRALAEWAILVAECQTFYERRKAEGVPNIKSVETPTLGVESFRKPMG